MKTQKHYLLGFDVTPRKALYAEIDALTEENREQAEEIVKLQNRIDEQAHTIMAHRNRINLLNSDNSEYYQTIKSQKREIATFKAKATELEEKYNAAVKYQQNTQAAYDELKADYDRILAHTKWGHTEGESKDKVTEADAVPTECDTAKTIGAKAAQPRDKGGRFEKSKRDGNPRK